MPEKTQNIYTGLEHEGTRRKNAVENQFNKAMRIGFDSEKPPQLNIDKLLTSRCEEAVKKNENEIRILDFGSGKIGALIFSLSKKKDFPKFHEFLQNHPKFKVNVVGFTSMNNKDQGSILDTKDVTVASENQISITNYAYTVTRKHTVQKFLDQIKLTEQPFEIILATWSLGYLTPTNFAQALEDLTNNLEKNGKLYCTPYHAVDPGFARTMFGDQWLNIPEENQYSFLRRSWEVFEMKPKNKQDTVLKQINLLLRLNSKLQDEILDILKDKFTYNNDYLEKNKLRQAIQNLRLRRIKNKFFKSEHRNLKKSNIPVELFENAFLWQQVVSSLNLILKREIRSKREDHGKKRELIEFIGKLNGFNTIISDHAFILTKLSDTLKITGLVEKI